MKTYDERTRDVLEKIVRKRRRRRIAVGTAALTCAAVLALILFLPYNTNPPSVRAYQNSEYYSLIQKINEATFTPPEYANNFRKLTALLELRLANGDKTEAPGMAADGNMNTGAFVESPVTDGVDGEGLGSQYYEVTDNQVEGVIESDIIKRSDKYIYYLRGTELSVYSIAEENSALVGSFTLDAITDEDEIDEKGTFSYYHNVEMYLSEDCTTVTVLVDGYHSTIGICTTLVNLDVTDPEKITELRRVYLSGSYLSSRLVEGDLLLMSKFKVASNKDFSDESTYLPQIGQPGEMVSVAAEDIIAPETLSSTQYTVVCKLAGDTLEVMDTAAFLSYSEEIYVSNTHIFATRSYTESNDTYSSQTMTQISSVSYGGDTLEYEGSAVVEGTVKNQYSMDEYEGILRVVTSVANTARRSGTERNASLFCISLEDFGIAASVEKFAPAGEQAESVRFDGDYAYVCTAEVATLTDPVYFFDLSDLSNIVWKDTGTIDGYSSSLIQLGEGYLLGIGYGSIRGLKIEVYEETENGVASVCTYEQKAVFSEEYKNYLIDRERDLVGLSICRWGGDGTPEYILLHFDGYELWEIAAIPMSGDISQMRAVLIDGWLYVFGNDFAVEKIW